MNFKFILFLHRIISFSFPVCMDNEAYRRFNNMYSDLGRSSRSIFMLEKCDTKEHSILYNDCYISIFTQYNLLEGKRGFTPVGFRF